MSTQGSPAPADVNAWCRKLEIPTPDLARVKHHPQANTYGLLVVALLERGAPMTLAEVAERFAEVGIATRDEALRSLTRCKPARPPVYRDGDHYTLDVHHHELDDWVIRYGLNPLFEDPLPGEDIALAWPPGPQEALTRSELETAWKRGIPSSFPALRVAVAILDAHGGSLPADDVVAFATKFTGGSQLSRASAARWHKDAPVQETAEGRWVLDAAHPIVPDTRQAVRSRAERERKWAVYHPDRATLAARWNEIERIRIASALELARLRRVVVHAFPTSAPQAVVLIDVADRGIETVVAGDDEAWLERVRQRLASYDVIIGLDVRALLRGLGFDAGERRVVDLTPPQKSMRLNRRGRTLRITTAMLVWGSCGISRPLADPAKLRGYLRKHDRSRLLRRLVADAKSLFWLYEYGRLHGRVRLRWGFRDVVFTAPWVDPDETRLSDLCRLAIALPAALEVVAGSAPGWSEPWSRKRRCQVQRYSHGFLLSDEDGRVIDQRDVQLARLETIERTLH
ncbi:MAG TPA: hypothetical protein VIS07_13670 [Candidatus Binatia bacterium]